MNEQYNAYSGSKDASPGARPSLGAMGSESGQEFLPTTQTSRKLLTTAMEGNTITARLSPAQLGGLFNVAKDLDIRLTPHGEFTTKIVRESIITGCVAGALAGLTMGANAGIAALVGTAAAVALVRVCEVRVKIAEAPQGDYLVTLAPLL